MPENPLPTGPESSDAARQTDRTVYLVDGTAYIYRAYHAIRSLANSKGMPTNAVFGFTRMLMKLFQEREPSYVCMFFDARGPTFRHKMYADYKANRPPMPEDLSIQIPIIKSVTAGFNVHMVEREGYEADDLIGTVSRLSQQAGFSVVMVTGDKDFMQLVTDRAAIWDPMKETAIDRKTIREQYGLDPEQMIDVMGLSGDTADNIPGVPGIGPKTALQLIQRHGSMDRLYRQLDTVTAKKQRENLAAFRDQAFLSRALVVIDTAAPVDFSPEAMQSRQPDKEKLFALFSELEFRQLQQSFSELTDASADRTYRMVVDEAELRRLCRRLEEAGLFALDTETTSTDPMRARLVGISVSDRPDAAYYIPCGHDYLGAPEQIPLATVRAVLGPLLQNPELKKVGQNIKYDCMVLVRHGITVNGVAFDTMLASYLLNPSKRSHSLDQIAMDFLGHKTITYEEVAGKGKQAVGFNAVPVEKAVPYACEDADITLKAFRHLKPALEAAGLTELMETVEMPLVPVLMRMEMTGICVDGDKLQHLSKAFDHRLGQIEENIYALAGERFNIRSSQQLGRILFEKLALPVQKKTRKKTGYSTDMDVLTTLAETHELPAVVLEHRTLSKLKSTYTDALLDLINPETRRIHTSFNQTVAATGRLSSSEPNLQNIPIRTEAGREIRRAFVPRPGWHLVSADYSQIELRILAHCSEDPIFIRAFERGEDIHTRTAVEVFMVMPPMVSDELRRQAKAINFGIIYGMSPFGLSKNLGISQAMAKTYIDSYFERYSGVKRYIDRTIAEARKTLQTSTLMGRIRLLPEINASNRNVRQFAERMAVNTPIQGTAADLIKLAMIRVDAALSREKLASAMLLSVHDEIIFEAPPDELETVKRLAVETMESVWALKVPLKVNVDSGSNWAEAH